jgi:hypothetical protein
MIWDWHKEEMKPVVQMDKSGTVLEIYPSAEEAARLNNLRANHITECCRGVKSRKTVGEYKWEYAEVKDE